MTEALFASAAEAASWAAHLPEGTPGRMNFEYRSETSSTQDDAFAAAEQGAPGGSVFVAEEQRAGRGRRGSSWSAPAGSSLLLSVLLRPGPAPEHAGRTSLGAALALCLAVEKLCGVAPAVKWPNDLLLGERKFGGILVEVRGAVAAMGIGVNVSQRPDEFGDGIRDTATSLMHETRAQVDRTWLLGLLLAEVGRLLGEGGEAWERIRLEVCRRLAWRGRRARVGELSGTVTGLDDEGYLLMQAEGGRTVRAVSGSMELVPE